jgi:hypothetical protein
MMLMRRIAPKAAAACLLVVVAVAILIGVGRAESAAAPTSITAGALSRSLALSGLEITPVKGRPRNGSSEVVGGIAYGTQGARVEFEFAVAANGQASTRQLGGLGIPIRRSGPNQNRPDRVRVRSGERVTPVIRGVVGNVAYALYYFGIREAPPDATREVVRRLDAALFDAFPARDAEAHAVMQDPG